MSKASRRFEQKQQGFPGTERSPLYSGGKSTQHVKNHYRNRAVIEELETKLRVAQYQAEELRTTVDRLYRSESAANRRAIALKGENDRLRKDIDRLSEENAELKRTIETGVKSNFPAYGEW